MDEDQLPMYSYVMDLVESQIQVGDMDSETTWGTVANYVYWKYLTWDGDQD